jgi:hypothetical protein
MKPMKVAAAVLTGALLLSVGGVRASDAAPPISTEVVGFAFTQKQLAFLKEFGRMPTSGLIRLRANVQQHLQEKKALAAVFAKARDKRVDKGFQEQIEAIEETIKLLTFLIEGRK